MTALVGLLFALTFLLSLACYSLRDFSRSRLEQICRQRGNVVRFGQILKRHERALVIADTLLTLTVAVTGTTVCLWQRLLRTAGTDVSEWINWAAVWLFWLVALFLTAVVVPRSVARVAGERFLYRAWPVLRALPILAKPVWDVAYWFDRLVHRVLGLGEPGTSDVDALREEIRSVVDEGGRSGVLEEEATSMINRVIRLTTEDASVIMTPRPDMVCIPVTCTLEEARQRLLQAGHSRVPVIGKSPDDIVGILYAKDLLKYARVQNNETKLADAVRQPLYVPDSASVDSLLETMKQQRTHMAIVIDEYGGVAGLVTLEDVLEEIVGEISDEYDSGQRTMIRQTGPNAAEVDARLSLVELNRELDLGLPEDQGVDTLNGFIIAELGRIPKRGETLTWRHLKITVLEADSRRVRRARIQVDPALQGVTTDD